MPFKRASVRYSKTPVPETPYQAAQQLWDERIGSARVQAANWRRMAFGSLGLAFLVAAGAAAVATGVGGYRLARGIGSAVRAQGARMAGAGSAGGGASGGSSTGAPAPAQSSGAPTWAQRLRSKFAQGSRTSAHTVRSADRPGAGPHPDLSDKKDE